MQLRKRKIFKLLFLGSFGSNVLPKKDDEKSIDVLIDRIVKSCNDPHHAYHVTEPKRNKVPAISNDMSGKLPKNLPPKFRALLMAKGKASPGTKSPLDLISFEICMKGIHVSHYTTTVYPHHTGYRTLNGSNLNNNIDSLIHTTNLPSYAFKPNNHPCKGKVDWNPPKLGRKSEAKLNGIDPDSYEKLLNYFIPCHGIVSTRIMYKRGLHLVAPVVLTYNPNTKSTVHLYVYACKDSDSAISLNRKLEKIVCDPGNRDKLFALERQLFTFGLLRFQDDGNSYLKLPIVRGILAQEAIDRTPTKAKEPFGSSAAALLKYDDSGISTSPNSGSATSKNSFLCGDDPAERPKVANIVFQRLAYPARQLFHERQQALADELKCRLLEKSKAPVYIPPKDYSDDTDEAEGHQDYWPGKMMSGHLKTNNLINPVALRTGKSVPSHLDQLHRYDNEYYVDDSGQESVLSLSDKTSPKFQNNFQTSRLGATNPNFSFGPYKVLHWCPKATKITSPYYGIGNPNPSPAKPRITLTEDGFMLTDAKIQMKREKCGLPPKKNYYETTQCSDYSSNSFDSNRELVLNPIYKAISIPSMAPPSKAHNNTNQSDEMDKVKGFLQRYQKMPRGCEFKSVVGPNFQNIKEDHIPQLSKSSNINHFIKRDRADPNQGYNRKSLLI